jgi:hypothetical protein
VLCVTAQIVRHETHASPGGKITYSVWVWSTVKAQRVSASLAANLNLVRPPQFTLCPTAHATSCSIGTLPANQALEMLITDRVRTTAALGRQVTLTVTVTGAQMSPAVAAITIVVGQSNPLPTVSTTLPTGLFPTFPNTTVSPGSLSGLFPVVTPSPSSSGPPQRSKGTVRRLARLTSSAVPIDPRQIGGQLAGLAVLAAAITMAVARLSLRTPQPAAGSPAATAEAAVSASDGGTGGTASASADGPASASADGPASPTTAADNAAPG